MIILYKSRTSSVQRVYQPAHSVMWSLHSCIHFHPKSHFCFGTLLVNSAVLVSTDTTATAVKEYCSASHALHCTTFHQVFLACGASGQQHTPTTRVHATIAPAQKPAFVILSPRLLFMVQCDGIPCMATVKDSRGKFFSPNCEGKMHKCSWRQCSRWLEHSFFRSQCPYKLNKLADTTLVFCLIGHSFKRKRLLQNLVMGTEKRIRIIACKHKTAYVGRKILGSRFLSSWWNAMQ